MRRVVLLLLIACSKEPGASPAPSASASASASVSAVPIQSAAEPPPSASAPPKALAGVPPVELACAKDTDCGPSFWSDACCNQCEPRIGTKAWSKKMDVFCTKPENKGSGCTPRPCGYVFGAPRCSAGQCVAK